MKTRWLLHYTLGPSSGSETFGKYSNAVLRLRDIRDAVDSFGLTAIDYDEHDRCECARDVTEEAAADTHTIRVRQIGRYTGPSAETVYDSGVHWYAAIGGDG